MAIVVADTTPCPTMCPTGLQLRTDGAMIRWRGSTETVPTWIDCRDVPSRAHMSSAACRAAHEHLRDGHCCVPPPCQQPSCVVWPSGELPLQEDGMVTCRAIVDDPHEWERLVVDRSSCRISRMLVDVHCGGDCSRGMSSSSVQRSSAWNLVGLLVLGVSLAGAVTL